MKETNKLALVTRPSLTLEKKKANATGILSNMVADTLALAPPNAFRLRRIVMLDDIEAVRLSLKHTLKCFPGLEILDFDNGDSAWAELSRADPDLFMTDVSHPGMKCPDMLTALATRKAKYPIIVLSGTLRTTNVKVIEDTWRVSAGDLDVSFMHKPPTLLLFLEAVRRALRIPPQPAP